MYIYVIKKDDREYYVLNVRDSKENIWIHRFLNSIEYYALKNILPVKEN